MDARPVAKVNRGITPKGINGEVQN